MKHLPLIVSLVFIFTLGCKNQTVKGKTEGQKEIDHLNNQAFEERNSQTKKSFQIAHKALTKSKEINYAYGRFRSYLNIGTLFYIDAKYDSAANYLYQSEYYFRNSNSFEEGLANYYLGGIHRRLRNSNTAKKYLEKSESVFIAVNNIEFTAYSKNVLGILNGMQGNFLAALEYFIKASKLKESEGISNKEELGNIAIAYRHLKEYDKALDFAKKGLMKNQVEGDSSDIAAKHDIIGDILKSMDLLDSALFHYKQSHKISRSINDQILIKGALFEIASIHRHTGQYDSALTLLKSSLRSLTGNSIQNDLRLYLHNAIGGTYLDLNKPDSAIYFSSIAFQSASKGNFIKNVIKSSEVIKKSYQKLGNWEKAFEYAELLEKYRDTLEINNQDSRFSDLRVLIETKDQEKIIASLEKQSEIDSLTKQRLIFLIGAIILALGGATLIIYLTFKNKQRLRNLENENLKREAEKSKKELYEQTLHMVHLNNMYNRIEENLKEVDKQKIPEVRRILQKINIDKTLEKEWDNFQNYFSNVHGNFQKNLNREDIQLTENERRICSLIKVNLTNREIASLLNINEKSVRMSKYRLKKKLNLAEEEDLKRFILELD